MALSKPLPHTPTEVDKGKTTHEIDIVTKKRNQKKKSDLKRHHECIGK